MFDTQQTKALAKEQLRGELIMLCIVSIFPSVVSAVLTGGTAGIAAVVALLGTPLLGLGVAHIFLKRANGEGYTFTDIFTYYPLWWKAFKADLLIAVQVFLWSLLFVVPGFISYLRCSMADYILAENPDLTATEAVALSKEMTRGKIWNLVCFEFSFIGWYILTVATGGIASLWVIPYHTAAYTNVYLALKEDYRSGGYAG